MLILQNSEFQREKSLRCLCNQRAQAAQKGTTMAIQLIEDDEAIQAWKPKPLERMSDGGGLFLLSARVAGRRHA